MISKTNAMIILYVFRNIFQIRILHIYKLLDYLITFNLLTMAKNIVRYTSYCIYH